MNARPDLLEFFNEAIPHRGGKTGLRSFMAVAKTLPARFGGQVKCEFWEFAALCAALGWPAFPNGDEPLTFRASNSAAAQQTRMRDGRRPSFHARISTLVLVRPASQATPSRMGSAGFWSVGINNLGERRRLSSASRRTKSLQHVGASADYAVAGSFTIRTLPHPARGIRTGRWRTALLPGDCPERCQRLLAHPHSRSTVVYHDNAQWAAPGTFYKQPPHGSGDSPR
jgi:hypothetical protein